MKAFLVLLALLSGVAFAQTQQENEPGTIVGGMDGSEEPVAETTTREPAQENIPGKPAKEDELRVLPQLPDAQLKRDARSIQREVYKSIYNRELKPDQREDVLDE